ncbi:PTS sugar transporter subunit IIA [Candidatus Aminicenantes bacterium AH-873-B07]|jgi:fructose-specific phosphotransferase system IIA component|nr:PTS sugar transporter subunit IIA [Candidatus Aminicenantes bacterium AH-873-B07]
MKLFKYLKKDCIFLDFENKEKDLALLKLTRFLKEKGLIRNEKDVYLKLMERERLQSTAIGKGVAIPHCFSDEIKDLIIIIVQSRKGINFNSPDKKPIRLIFLILGSKDNPSLHLKVLARIARLIKETEIIGRLIHCSNVEDIMRIFEEEEEKI